MTLNNNMLHEEIMDKLMDHYENPRNCGVLSGYSVKHDGGNPGCGDIITIYLKVNENDVIEEISFEGEGCIISQSSTSILTDMVKGKTFEEIKELNSEFMKQIIGHEMVIRRPKCSTLAIQTIKTAIKKFEDQKIIKNQKAI